MQYGRPQFGMQRAQAQALRQPTGNAPMASNPPMMGTGPQQPTYIHPAENPGGGMAPPPAMPQQAMGRPSFGFGRGQFNRFRGR